ncbi:MAG: HEAT repeat domain-containing protein [Cyanobacteriota bacterium]
MGASILSVLALVGVALTYWYLQQKIDNQKRQTRKTFEELESNHEARMQEAVKFLQEDYQAKLAQATEELKRNLEIQLQDAITSLKDNSPTQLTQTVEEQETHQEPQLDEAILSFPDNEPVTSQNNEPVTSQNNEPVTFQDNEPVTSQNNEPVTFPDNEPVTSQNNEPVTFPDNEPVTFPDNEPVTFPDNEPVTSQENEPVTSQENEPVTFQENEPVTPTQTTESLPDTSDLWFQDSVESSQTLEEHYKNQPEQVTLPLEQNVDITTNESQDEVKEQVLEQTNVEITTTATEPPIFSTSSDNSQPSAQNGHKTTQKKAKDLGKEIIRLRNYGQVTAIPTITEYANHPDSRIRELVASALGSIATSQGIKAEIQRAIPLLGKLSRDSEPLVRQAAVEALGKIKSETVIPLLSLALRDCDSDVVKAASAAINNYKLYPMSQAKKPTQTPAKSSKR